MSDPEQPRLSSRERFVWTADELKSVGGALKRYRFMAYLVGTLLVVLVVIGMPLKYIWDNGTVVTWTGVPHGWLYLILLITAFDLGRRVRWGWGRLILIMLAGTVPFLSFVAERSASKDVKTKMSEATIVTEDELNEAS